MNFCFDLLELSEYFPTKFNECIIRESSTTSAVPTRLIWTYFTRKSVRNGETINGTATHACQSRCNSPGTGYSSITSVESVTDTSKFSTDFHDVSSSVVHRHCFYLKKPFFFIFIFFLFRSFSPNNIPKIHFQPKKVITQYQTQISITHHQHKLPVHITHQNLVKFIRIQ